MASKAKQHFFSFLILLSLLFGLNAAHASNWSHLKTDSSGAELSFNNTFKNQLHTAGISQSPVKVELPSPSGTLRSYYLSPSSTLSAADKIKFNIQTFTLLSLEGQQINGSLTLSSSGLSAMVFGEDGFVLRSTKANTVKSISLSKLETPEHMEAEVVEEALNYQAPSLARKTLSTGSTRTYVIGISTTGEYSEQVGGTKAAVIDALVKTLNAVNPIFLSELNMSFQLSSDNEKLIFLDPDTDPFANEASVDITKNTEVVDQLVGLENIDVGHVFGTASGGLATLRSVCIDEAKARSFSGFTFVENEYFYVSLFAHELGHQLGANHSFNAATSDEACLAGRNGATAWEPLSGSTIMSYLGLCAQGNNLSGRTVVIQTDQGQGTVQSAQPFFHIGSIDQINSNASNKTCGRLSVSTNSAPQISVPSGFFVPPKTPFFLEASATDPNSDTLSFQWEQYQQIPSDSLFIQNSHLNLATQAPLFRSFEPSSSASRFFPTFNSVLSGVLQKGESYAQTQRSIDLSFTARDKKGGVSSEMLSVEVTGSCPFQVLRPNSQTQWKAGANQSVYWDVADTNLAPVLCNSVDIIYSPTGEFRSPQTLAQGVANTGQASVQAPSALSSRSKLMVMCSDPNKPFYNVSKAFRVTTQGLSQAAPASLNNTCSVTQPDPEPEPDPGAGGVNPTTGSSGGGGGYSAPWVVLILLGTLLTSACAKTCCMAPKHQTDLAAQVQSAAELEAQANAAAKDYRLLVTVNRIKNVPGVEAQHQAKLLERCGSKVLAFSDAVSTPGQAEQIRTKTQYAAAYNTRMAKLCKADSKLKP